MGRILAVIEDLEPVAREVERERHHFRFRLIVGVEHREIGYVVRRAHVGEYNALELVDGIGAVPQRIRRCGCGIVRGLDNPPVGSVVPAVIATHDAFVRRQAIFKRGTTVGTMAIEQSRFTLARAKQHQRLAKHVDVFRKVAKLRRECHRQPETSEILAAWRARANMRKFCVLSDILGAVIRSERLV